MLAWHICSFAVVFTGHHLKAKCGWAGARLGEDRHDGWLRADHASAGPSPALSPSACALPGTCLPLYDAQARAPVSVHLQPCFE